MHYGQGAGSGYRRMSNGEGHDVEGEAKARRAGASEAVDKRAGKDGG